MSDNNFDVGGEFVTWHGMFMQLEFKTSIYNYTYPDLKAAHYAGVMGVLRYLLDESGCCVDEYPEEMAKILTEVEEKYVKDRKIDIGGV